MRPLLLGFSAMKAVAVAGAALALLASACGGSPAALATPSSMRPLAATRLPPGALASLLVASVDLGVGPQRFAVAIFDSDQRPITDASVRLRFFKVLGQDQAELRAEAAAPFRGQGLQNEGLQDRGVYAAPVTFDSPGTWGVEALAVRPGHPQESVRASFEVPARSQTPAIGDPAPASRNKTITDVGSVEELTSARPPDPDLYRLAIADAIAQRRPFLVVFATPAFCTSRACGPALEQVHPLKAKYGDRVGFIHVEIYNDPVGLLKGGSDRSVRPAVLEWNLPTEPYAFLVDGRGLVFDKFEGFVPAAELEEAVLRLLAAP
ncbi:MAG: hypothetical protein EXR60_01950 [Dehalococcoidia bacterium]|nr:hypothetical protein [Dehalococcoidia bacterium]